ncbi:MAG: hypothetical protein K2H86_05640 [Muribaculaceae bacterium]|nr:hypothetical protein [Muribaculaceae bacterium]
MKEIGAYFELELPLDPSVKSLHDDGVRLNSARHALEYILSLQSDIDSVWLPTYTCEVVYEPLKRRGVKVLRYNIDRNLKIPQLPQIGPEDIIILNNYYGILDAYINKIARLYGQNVIIDNAQAWYADSDNGFRAFYSPRKFFGLPDGGIAVNVPEETGIIDRDKSYDRCSHLLKRIDVSASAGYHDFTENSAKLSDIGMMRMSNLTGRLLNVIDCEKAKNIRLKNFAYLSGNLDSINELELPGAQTYECPMVYPLLVENGARIRRHLIENNIFVATYWPNVLEECPKHSDEYYLADNLLALPIDQRYGEEDMKRIVSVIKAKL